MSLDTLSCRGTVCLQRQLVLSIFACIYTPYALSHYIGYRQRAAATRPRGASTAPRPPPLLPPQRPCPLGSPSLHPRTPRTRLGTGGDSHGSSAAGAAQRTPTSSSCSAPQKPHALAGPRRPAFPVPSHGLCRAGLGAALGSRSVLPSTAHRSHKTSRGTHTCAAIARALHPAPT